MNSTFKIKILGALLLLLFIGQSVFAGGGWNSWQEYDGSSWTDGVGSGDGWMGEGGGADTGGWIGGDQEGGGWLDAEAFGDNIGNGESILTVRFNGRFPPNRLWQCTAVNRRNIPFPANGRSRWEAEQNALRDCFGHRSRFCSVVGCRVI